MALSTAAPRLIAFKAAPVDRQKYISSQRQTVGALSWAQEPTNEDLRRENEELKRRLAEAEQRLAERGAEPPGDAPPPAEGTPSADGRAKDGRLMGEVVVTATRGEAGTKTTGSTISTVTATEIWPRTTLESTRSNSDTQERISGAHRGGRFSSTKCTM